MKKSEVERLLIRLPPLSEQRHIAAALTEQLAAVKRARVAAEARLAAAKEVSKSILRSVFESHDALKWPRQMLADFAETCSGTTPDRNRPDYFGGKIPWVKTGELLDGIIECTGESVTELALGACSLSLLPPGTLLIAMYGQGQTRGRTAILAVPATTNQACFAILPNKDFDTRFLQFWFQYSYDRLRHETESRGGNQPNLNGVFLSRQNIPFPSLVDQRQIVARLSKQLNAAKTVYARIRDELATIDLMPEALLQLAFCEM
ncbi:MAG: hypothetical protein EXS05_19810 [Planctomycetaceae bacterium]|nr:hypothetical protein [Planctomycetaceae bacterium]